MFATFEFTVWFEIRVTERWVWSWTKPFDTLIVFVKEFFDKVNFEKSEFEQTIILFQIGGGSVVEGMTQDQGAVGSSWPSSLRCVFEQEH